MMNSACSHPNVWRVIIYVLMKLIIICAVYFIIFNKLFMSNAVNSIWCSTVRDGEKKPSLINIHWKSLSAVTHSHGDSFLSSHSKFLTLLSDISCYFKNTYILVSYIYWHSHDIEEQFLCDSQQTGSHRHGQQQQAEEDVQREIPAPQLSRCPWEKEKSQSQ